MLRIGLATVFGAVAALAAVLLGVGYEVIPLDSVAALAERTRANVELLTGGTLAAVAARLGVPAALAALRTQLTNAVKTTVEEMLGKK
jgi:hypothetical protein